MCTCKIKQILLVLVYFFIFNLNSSTANNFSSCNKLGGYCVEPSKCLGDIVNASCLPIKSNYTIYSPQPPNTICCVDTYDKIAKNSCNCSYDEASFCSVKISDGLKSLRLHIAYLMFNKKPDIFDERTCEPKKKFSVISEGRGDYFMFNITENDLTEKALLERYLVLKRIFYYLKSIACNTGIQALSFNNTIWPLDTNNRFKKTAEEFRQDVLYIEINTCGAKNVWYTPTSFNEETVQTTSPYIDSEKNSKTDFDAFPIIIVFGLLVLIICILWISLYFIRKMSKRKKFASYTRITQDMYTIDLENRLGSGYFGSVYMGILKNNDGKSVPVAIKILKAKDDYIHPSDLIREAEVMTQLRNIQHKHLALIYGINMDDGLKIFLKYRALGSLHKFLKTHRTELKSADLIRFGFQITKAMEFLARNNFVHRDLATRNVLIKSKDHVEVSDFGLAVKKDDKEFSKFVCSKWASIELLEDNTKFSEFSDVWAFGVTCWEIINFGREPYEDLKYDEKLKDKLLEGFRREYFLEPPSICDATFYRKTMLECWSIQIEKRPSFKKLKQLFKYYNKSPKSYVQVSLCNKENQGFDQIFKNFSLGAYNVETKGEENLNSYRKSPQNEKFAKLKDDYENKTTLKKDSSVELEMLIAMNNDTQEADQNGISSMP